MFEPPAPHTKFLTVPIHIVHLGADDQAVHRRGALAASIGSTEEPGLSAKGDPPEGALGGFVAATYAYLSPQKVAGLVLAVPAGGPVGC